MSSVRNILISCLLALQVTACSFFTTDISAKPIQRTSLGLDRVEPLEFTNLESLVFVKQADSSYAITEAGYAQLLDYMGSIEQYNILNNKILDSYKTYYDVND